MDIVRANQDEISEKEIEQAIKDRARVLASHPVNQSMKEEIATLSLFMEACFAMAARTKAIERAVGGTGVEERDREAAIAFKLFDALMESIRQPAVVSGSPVDVRPLPFSLPLKPMFRE